MPVSVRLAVPADFPDIVKLQNENYIENLSAQQRSDGFVSTSFSPELLHELSAPNCFFVARDDATNELAGYVFAGSWAFCARWPAFQKAIERFPLRWKGDDLNVDDTFQYGPVCVAQSFRGQGVLSLLFEAVKCEMRDEFSVGTTWINAANGRSMKAHTQKLGLVALDEFELNASRFVLLGFETR